MHFVHSQLSKNQDAINSYVTSKLKVVQYTHNNHPKVTKQRPNLIGQHGLHLAREVRKSYCLFTLAYLMFQKEKSSI